MILNDEGNRKVIVILSPSKWERSVNKQNFFVLLTSAFMYGLSTKNFCKTYPCQGKEDGDF